MSLLITAYLVLARVSGLIMSMPLLESPLIPRMVKGMLALSITLVIAPVVPAVEVDMSLSLLLFGFTSEMVLGILMGGAISIVFSSLSVASGIISTQIGQAAAQQFNPSMSVTASPVGNIAIFMATAIFLGLDSHLHMIQLLAESFNPLPPNDVVNPVAGARVWMEYSMMVFVTGLQMAGPVLSLVLMVNSFIAILSKVAPSMNMFFSVGFIISMMFGMLLFIYMLPHILVLHQNLVEEHISRLPEIFELVGR